ncbi:unnamed protein product [Miscanthus lutarioriparius]|uniref:DUF659 domain-containing protein n=1 Tax=Miscanthus lutarioriparius TaxID=422564 RepID=A0A811QZ07_9POAL|nr:unnamed protein product [Miscanthus lutarioriparius]
MEAYLQKKRRRPLFLDGIEEEDGEDEVVEVATTDVEAERTPEQIVDQRRAKDFQPTIESSTKTKEEKQYVDLQWALWFMECGVSFNATNSRQFEIAYEATTQYGSGYKSPTNQQLGEPLLQECVKEKIEDIVKDNVVQVVTNNGANYKATGKILMDRIPTLFWSPCAAHCLDLMLEEFWNLKAFKKPIARARCVTPFIYRHGRHLSAMRAQTGGTDLVRVAKTQFATSFLTLKSLYKNKDALKSLFVSEAWIGNNLCTTTAVEDCLRASAPLLIVLRVVDGDQKPAMPEVTALMNHAKERIKLSFNISTKQGLLKHIMDIIEKHWVNQMEHPLYGAALYLNPGNFYPLVKANDDAIIGQLRGCFIEVLGRMIPDVETQMKINSNLIAFQTPNMCCTFHPVDWWPSYGGRAIELQRLAKRIMHTKKRNRLLHKRLNDIVFVSYNQKMRTRVQLMREKAGKKYDPLVIEEFDWDNKWADSLHVPIPGARGSDAVNELTWQHVDEATVSFKGDGCYMGEELLKRKERNMGSRIGNKRGSAGPEGPLQRCARKGDQLWSSAVEAMSRSGGGSSPAVRPQSSGQGLLQWPCP